MSDGAVDCVVLFIFIAIAVFPSQLSPILLREVDFTMRYRPRIRFRVLLYRL